jgi:hypothetical protein
MSDKVVFTGEVANHAGGEDLMLEIGIREGQVFIRLYPPEDTSRTLALVTVPNNELCEIQAALEKALNDLP